MTLWRAASGLVGARRICIGPLFVNCHPVWNHCQGARGNIACSNKENKKARPIVWIMVVKMGSCSVTTPPNAFQWTTSSPDEWMVLPGMLRRSWFIHGTSYRTNMQVPSLALFFKSLVLQVILFIAIHNTDAHQKGEYRPLDIMRGVLTIHSTEHTDTPHQWFLTGGCRESVGWCFLQQGTEQFQNWKQTMLWDGPIMNVKLEPSTAVVPKWCPLFFSRELYQEPQTQCAISGIQNHNTRDRVKVCIMFFMIWVFVIRFAFQIHSREFSCYACHNKNHITWNTPSSVGGKWYP